MSSQVFRDHSDYDRELEAARAAGETWAIGCLNCGASLDGHFCSRCGQRVVPPNPTVRELAGEAFAEFSGWDGKLATTAKLLLARPGQLTCDFLAGRRARYIQPIRLYLVCSVAFFLLAASVPNQNRGGAISITSGASVGRRSPNDVVVPISGKATDMTAEQRQKLSASIDSAHPLLRPVMRRVADDPKGFSKGVFEAMPKGLFVLLPVFACILGLFYRRRHFTEHLYFALHLHAFAFFALSLNAIAKWLKSPLFSAATGVMALIWIVVYAHLAFKRVYGESHARTLLKEVGIAALYIAASIPTIIGVALWVARA